MIRHPSPPPPAPLPTQRVLDITCTGLLVVVVVPGIAQGSGEGFHEFVSRAAAAFVEVAIADRGQREATDNNDDEPPSERGITTTSSSSISTR